MEFSPDIQPLLAQLPPEVMEHVRRLLEEKTNQVRALEAALQEQRTENAALKARLEALERLVHGPRSEKMPPMRAEVERELNAPEVERLAAELAAQEGASEPTAAHEKKARRKAGRARSEEKRKRKRQELAKLPRVEETIEVKPEDLPAGMTMEDFQAFGSHDCVVRISYVRSHLCVKRYILPKVQSRTDSSVIVQARAPASPAPGGLYDASVYAAAIAMRILDLMPLQRIASSWKRLGMEIAPSVIVSFLHRAAFLLQPIATELRKELQTAHLVCADETPQPMQNPGAGKVARGWMWVALSSAVIVYHFSKSRAAAEGRELLGDKVANLMADGYSAYNNIAMEGGRAACWAHVRRTFFERRENWDEAHQVLHHIQQMYRLEYTARMAHHDLAEVRRVRQTKIREHVEAIFAIVDRLRDTFPPTSSQAKAIGYVDNRRAELSRFLDDPLIPLDNNVSERALRVVALGRKNSLFVGPGDCGKTYATLMTVVHTCRLHDIDVEAYLTDVLPRLAPLLDAPAKHPGLEEAQRRLTPRAWQRDRQQQGTPVV